jgi:hypothetical protein
VPGDARLGAEEGLLAGIRAPLDELHHAHLHAMAERARHQAEARAGLALAVAGIDQQHAALGLRGGDLVVDDVLLARHAGVVPGVAVGGLGHAKPFVLELVESSGGAIGAAT